MNKRDFALALMIVTAWGVNFTVIKLGLHDVPSMLLAALRYLATAFPALLFIKPPAVAWRYTIGFGLTVGLGQFASLFYAIEIGMPAGIASVVLQSQAFFTFLFAAMTLKEKIQSRQILGLMVGILGLYFIGGISGTTGISEIPLGGLLLTIVAAASAGFSNIVIKLAYKSSAAKGQKLDMLSLVVWSSLVPIIPMLGIALALDTPQTLLSAVQNMDLKAILAVLYIAYVATLFGNATWSELMAKYPVTQVAPISHLVPITGLITAQIVLAEYLDLWQWLGCFVILIGLVIMNFGMTPLRLLLRKK
ncbi:MAG: EamA family transporter [Desulfitobacterium sp.]